MKRVLVVAASMLGVGACLTTYNSYRWTTLSDAPAVTTRPEGCSVEVFEDGQQVTRPHQDLGRIVMEFPESKLKQQGPDGAVATLKAAACEKGAFIVKDMRALTTGTQKGLVYEATLATLLGDDGRPLNEQRADAGPAPTPDPAPSPSGW